MTNYNYQSIKEIYGQKFKDDPNMSNNDIDNFYKYGSDISSNSIQLPDKIVSNKNLHGFTSYMKFLDNDISDRPKMDEYLFNNYSSYYKILKAKDIDWDNAYLKYLSIQKDYELPIEYQEIDPETGKLSNEVHYNSDYIFSNGLSNSSYTINYTYQLLNVIDYLFAKYNSLKFDMEVLKKQIDDKENYKNTH